MRSQVQWESERGNGDEEEGMAMQGTTDNDDSPLVAKLRALCGVPANTYEADARWAKVEAVLKILGSDIRGELGAVLLENATDATWHDLARRAGVRELSAYSRSLVVETIRRRGGR